MKTLQAFQRNPPQIPTTTVWLLSDLAEYRGKQELFSRQSPQKLEMLREHALIESAISSNRIEGIEIAGNRVGTVVFGEGLLHDRNEEEVRGYQKALGWIHGNWERIPYSVETILNLHALSLPDIWDSGKFKQDDGEIIEKHADGRVTLRFKPLSASETPAAMKQIEVGTEFLLRNKEVPPLLVWAAQNLDFLCVHPFRDGNGRVSRLLLLLMLYHLGFTAGRYISLERIIEQSKERYYETLKISSQSWHEGKHNPWPYINYLLYSLKALYQEFEDRFEHGSITVGEKTDAIRRAILGSQAPFHILELHRQCPKASLDLIRKVLKDMKKEQVIECIGRGKYAKWRLIDNR